MDRKTRIMRALALTAEEYDLLFPYPPRTDTTEVTAAKEAAMVETLDSWEAAMVETAWRTALEYQGADALAPMVRNACRGLAARDTASGYCHQVRRKVHAEADRLGLSSYRP